MAPRSLNRREYGDFKQMLQKALSEIRLPSGIIDTNHIRPGSVRPSNCKMDATWNFVGNVTSNGVSLSNPPVLRSVETQTSQSNQNEIVEVNHRAEVGSADIYFLNALKQSVVLLLPPASKNVGRKIYVKRVDKKQGAICRVVTTGSDKLDDTDGVELASTQAVIIIASSSAWHVFSKLD